MKKWLLYVRYSLTGLVVYEVTTSDLYHDIGVLICTSIEHIQRIDYKEYNERSVNFWNEQGITIHKFNIRRGAL